jgi:hypothetical protein
LTRALPLSGWNSTLRGFLPPGHATTRKPSVRKYSLTKSILRAPMSIIASSTLPPPTSAELQLLAPPAALEYLVDQPLHRHVAEAAAPAFWPRCRPRVVLRQHEMVHAADSGARIAHAGQTHEPSTVPIHSPGSAT